MRVVHRRGLTMMEVTISVVLVGGVLVATLNLVGPTARATQLAGDEILAAFLADELIDEIAAQAYVDPDSDTGVIGPETGETSGGTRKHFDDIDDYDGWSALSGENRDGTAKSGLVGKWQRSVEVVHVVPGDPQTTSVAETGVKRITVTVTRNGITLATRQILCSRQFDESREGS